jgi:ribonuclease R
VVVKLAEAVPVTGGLTLELVEIDGKRPPKRSGTSRRGGAPRGARQTRQTPAKAEKDRPRPVTGLGFQRHLAHMPAAGRARDMKIV